MRSDRPTRLVDRGVGAEFKALIAQATRLFSLEVELARGELDGKAGGVASGAGLLVGAAAFGAVAVCLIAAAAVAALATTVAVWLAAVIVFAVYLGLATIMALVGLRQLKTVAPLVPAQALESLKGDLKWVETQLKSAGR